MQQPYNNSTSTSSFRKRSRFVCCRPTRLGAFRQTTRIFEKPFTAAAGLHLRHAGRACALYTCHVATTEISGTSVGRTYRTRVAATTAGLAGPVQNTPRQRKQPTGHESTTKAPSTLLTYVSCRAHPLRPAAVAVPFQPPVWKESPVVRRDKA